MAENKNATVNNNAATENAQEQQNTTEKKVKEKVTWNLGPIHIDLNPKVAKVLKVVGIGTAVVGVGAIGLKVGSTTTGKKKDDVIDAQVAEISRLNSLLDATPKAIECAAETVVEAVPEAVEAISE